jgi:hypothetical protein
MHQRNPNMSYTDQNEVQGRLRNASDVHVPPSGVRLLRRRSAQAHRLARREFWLPVLIYAVGFDARAAGIFKPTVPATI